MDVISFSEAATANSRIEIINANPDSTSGIVTVPKVIASGETITIPTGRVAVLPNLQIEGTLDIQGDVFIPSGSTFGDLESQIALKANINSPSLTGTPTAPTQTAGDNSTKLATTAYVDGKMVLGTAVNASGTSIDFTGIPSWVKKITVMFNGVSTNGTSNPLIQVGSGSVVTTGYLGAGEQQGTNTAYTKGFGVPYTAAANLYYGSITIMLLSQNTYSASGIIGTTSTCGRTQGSVALSSTLDRIRITTVNGTDIFDAGSINIMYEG